MKGSVLNPAPEVPWAPMSNFYQHPCLHLHWPADNTWDQTNTVFFWRWICEMIIHLICFTKFCSTLKRSDFPGGSDGKASVYSVRDLGSFPRLGRFPGERNGNPLQYSCLENPMDGGAWCRLLSMELQSRAWLATSLFNLDTSLCFIQPGILHDVLCIDSWRS